ncbi:UvrD-helicase domain-containing protein [Pectobacterium actinidiae]|uniref:UvrD-helicase domain-containing protein n=1 Tax=Pectobacterium actinidiae TaxID=1507808 RepID=UPI0038273CB8
MDQKRLGLEPEVVQIFKLMDENKCFLLSGGAGSGKTYSLVQVINQALIETPCKGIACITYTNAAVDEIRGRIANKRLYVATIHEFLWDLIGHFKSELIDTLIKLLNKDSQPKINIPDDDFDPETLRGKILQYKEYTLIKEAIISHDEVLIIANAMFESYKKICDIAKDRYKLILVDEYQDTSELVTDILLIHLHKSKRNNIVGFFGDSMQSIYDNGVNNLDKYLEYKMVYQVKKMQNRRNPKLIYELANRLRTDGIVQDASSDNNAPNMFEGKVIQGDMKFIYTLTDSDKVDEVKRFIGWDFTETQQNKELNLTHNLIAPKAGFSRLMEIYDGDKIISYRNRIKEFIKSMKPDFSFDDLSFGEVIDYLVEFYPDYKKEVSPTTDMHLFILNNMALYEKALLIPFNEFKSIYISKDALIDDKKENLNSKNKSNSQRDVLIKHIFKIQEIIDLYQNEMYNEFLRKTEFRVRSFSDKKKLKDIVDKLVSMSDLPVSDVISCADSLGICRVDDRLLDFKKKNGYLFDRVMKIEFKEFQNLFYYLEGYTPFSTQHKIKGAQFDNVIVILDNGRWNKYNFGYLFENKGAKSVIERTKKLFYVCCTRSKKSLVVYYSKPSDEALKTAKNWFGTECVICIDELES